MTDRINVGGNPVRVEDNTLVSVNGRVDALSLVVRGPIFSTQNEDNTWVLLPDNFCVAVPRAAVCPVGWRARSDVKWDTEDESNADSKDGIVAWDLGNNGSVGMSFCCRGNGF